MPIDHIEIEVADPESSRRFYAAALAPLGYALRVEGKSLGFGDGDGLDFWIKPGSPSRPRPHFAFRCPTREAVRRSYDAALAGGGTDNGEPALLARIHPAYYAGFVHDPDGHNVEFVCQSEA